MSDDLKIDRRTLLKTAVSAGAAAAAPAVLATDANAVRWSEVHDVVIAGAGGAGLAAAVMAGGISKTSSSSRRPRTWAATHVLPTPSMRSTRGPEAARHRGLARAARPPDARDGPLVCGSEARRDRRYGCAPCARLAQRLGVRFEPGVYRVYGSLWPRTVRPNPRARATSVRSLFKCRELGVSIRTGTKVLRVIRKRAQGPRPRRRGRAHERTAPLHPRQARRRGGTGGFGANAELVGRFAPRLGHLRSTNLPGTTGDLIAPLEDIGAAAVGMDFFQLLPGSAEDGRFIGAASPVERMIFVNRAGRGLHR